MTSPARPADLRSSWLARALLAGLAGALVLDRFEATVERAVLGREPVYSARRIVRRWLPRDARRGARGPAVTTALRYGYALALSLVVARTRVWLPRSTTASAAILAAAIASCELALLPRVGAVPPLSRWRRSERVLLFAHAAVFTLVATACDEAVSAAARTAPRRARA